MRTVAQNLGVPFEATDPERALAFSYADRDRRAALIALFALDDTLAHILRTTREPLVGQMRLTWWHDALTALDTAPPPAQPALQALAQEVLPRGVNGARLAGMIDGWEVLIEPGALDREQLDSYAAQRGTALFEMAGQVLGATPRDPLAVAGAGWALADLAAHSRDPAQAVLPTSLAKAALDEATGKSWSRNARALGALAHSARMTVMRPNDAVGAPRRVARLAWHRITGR